MSLTPNPWLRFGNICEGPGCIHIFRQWNPQWHPKHLTQKVHLFTIHLNVQDFMSSFGKVSLTNTVCRVSWGFSGARKDQTSKIACLHQIGSTVWQAKICMESSPPLGTFHIARHQQLVDKESLTLTCQAISKTSTRSIHYNLGKVWLVKKSGSTWQKFIYIS